MRNRYNKIWRLEDGNGGWCNTSGSIGLKAQEYFQELLQTSTSIDPSGHFDSLRSKISNTMNRRLTQLVLEREIKFVVPHVGVQDKYVGLLFVVGRSKRTAYDFIKEKVTKKLHHWKRSLLSIGGKEVLIKELGTTIHLYSLGCLKLLNTLLEEIQKAMVFFWWGQRGNERKMHWIDWNVLCKVKSEGGLGFKNLKAFNLAMLGKQAWRILTREHSLVHKVFKNKYFCTVSFVEASVGANSSWAWWGLLEGRKVIDKGLR
ncbi:hypothetical protein Cni_G12759 [Canna indica]|uniref:Reverse transcriptase n=1 Tax=Canna indica TaxID=4628 RepID=A0AAQ3K8E2_9LILI|nr:hypothetical protein Cni_G12759 [Canna indica]